MIFLFSENNCLADSPSYVVRTQLIGGGLVAKPKFYIIHYTNILCNKAEMYEKFDIMLKEIDKEYRTTLINFR